MTIPKKVKRILDWLLKGETYREWSHLTPAERHYYPDYEGERGEWIEKYRHPRVIGIVIIATICGTAIYFVAR